MDTSKIKDLALMYDKLIDKKEELAVAQDLLVKATLQSDWALMKKLEEQIGQAVDFIALNSPKAIALCAEVQKEMSEVHESTQATQYDHSTDPLSQLAA